MEELRWERKWAAIIVVVFTGVAVVLWQIVPDVSVNMSHSIMLAFPLAALTWMSIRAHVKIQKIKRRRK